MDPNQDLPEVEESRPTIPGAKNMRTGALVPVNEGNGTILKRKDMVPCQLVRTTNEDGSPGPYEEAEGSDQIETILATGNIALMAKALDGVEEQRNNIIATLMRTHNGPEYLASRGIDTPEVEDVNVVADPQAQLERAENIQSATEKRQKADIEAKRKKAAAAQEKRMAELKAKAEQEEMEERADKEAQESRDAIAAAKEAEELAELEKQTAPNGDDKTTEDEL